jgi:predicted secreted protein
MRLQAHAALSRKATLMRGFFIDFTCLALQNTSWSINRRTNLRSKLGIIGMRLQAHTVLGLKATHLRGFLCSKLFSCLYRTNRRRSGSNQLPGYSSFQEDVYFSEIKMTKFKAFFLSLGLLMAAFAHAQPPLQTSGTLVVVPASGTVKHANDEATLTFMVEEQDKDKAVAASRVNQKMKQGSEIVKKSDPDALLKTKGYYTYAVYPDAQPRSSSSKPRQPIGWRVGQYLEVKTGNLKNLPKMTAAAQSVLALNGIHFGLAEATAKKMDAQQIAATYQNLNERIVAIAKAMGRNPNDAMLETVDFEGSGNYVPQNMSAPKMMRAAVAEADAVEEPSFEPGETSLTMRVVGKVRFR